jgi:hypothetical protein
VICVNVKNAFKKKKSQSSKRRTGKPNTGRFQKGHKPAVPFPKGFTPWSKLNKGKYFYPHKRIGIGYNCAKYMEWSRQVKDRDENKCRECGSKQNLHAHHILDFKNHIEERFNIDNGLTLCKSCHMSLERKLNPKKRKILCQAHLVTH